MGKYRLKNIDSYFVGRRVAIMLYTITTLLHTKYGVEIKVKLKLCDRGLCLNKGKLK